MLRAVAWVLGILIGLAVAGYVYLTVINPPFQLPETGYLSASEARNVRLGPDSPVVAYRVRASFDARIYTESSRDFDPARISALLRTDAPPEAEVAVHVYPADGAAVSDLVARTDVSGLSWRIPCDPPGDDACRREYLVVSSADDLVAETAATIELFAEQRFPTHVETPFLVGIDIDVDQVDLPPDARLRLGEATASATLAPDAPVARQTVMAAAQPDGQLLGTVLAVEVDREGDAIPTGLNAPAPVRLALLDDEGHVVADLGVRPGTRSAVVLPVLAGEHEIVTWWQDRADQTYQVDWSIEVGALASPTDPTVGLLPLIRPEPIRHDSGEGEREIGPDRNEAAEIGSGSDIGEPRVPDGLPAAIGVLHLGLELRGEETDAPALLILLPDRFQSDGSFPVPLRPGERVDLALDAFPSCLIGQCDPWHARLGTSDPFATERSRTVTLRWEWTLDVWPLDP